jgi:chromosome segregation ATPase
MDRTITKLTDEENRVRAERSAYLSQIAQTKDVKAADDRKFSELEARRRAAERERIEARKLGHLARKELTGFEESAGFLAGKIAQKRGELEKLAGDLEPLEREMAELRGMEDCPEEIERGLLEDDVYRLKQRKAELEGKAIPGLQYQIRRVSSELSHLAAKVGQSQEEVEELEIRAISEEMARLFPI